MGHQPLLQVRELQLAHDAGGGDVLPVGMMRHLLSRENLTTGGVD